ncbi:dihydrolipoyl dehydrogenase family protein [Salaquimonas pukyongi]|uniref:dihydrolipoyl dehydrogenase family protein n=1 Tax=Salaquimonas pukyongi TaxID=2712698 RepID=UPI00096B827A|nr:FAD-dependent oxidoreductase [Salaquimonas pukyongi]
MTETLTPDICVIGAGSGGLTVAAAAASFGVEVVLIEKGKMGGDCLNYGCVPSKAILAAGKHAHAIEESARFGVFAGKPKVEFRKVNQHIKSAIAAIAPNDSVERFTALGVKVIEAPGRFTDPRTIEAGEYTIKARRFVVATGSSAFVPPIPGLDAVDYFTNETLFDNTRRPGHLIVIGGGPIGMEMAQAHLRLGSKVTVIEGLKALGKDDPELSAIVLEKLRGEGLEIVEEAMVSRVARRGKNGVRVHYKLDGKEGSVDGTDLLIATGRAVNVEGLGLEEAGIRHDRKGIEVKADLRTSNRRVYAIGDVAGGLQFTHVAGYHAGLVIRGILFRLTAKPDNRIIPWATYTDPELANVGLTEEEARKQYKDIHVLRWPYHENDRAIAEGKTAGMIKMITDRKGRILGVGIAGTGAGEMINMWALAISQKMKVKDVAGYIPPYPTMAEIGKRAAITYFAPMTRKPFVRSLIGFLRKFG